MADDDKPQKPGLLRKALGRTVGAALGPGKLSESIEKGIAGSLSKSRSYNSAGERRAPPGVVRRVAGNITSAALGPGILPSRIAGAVRGSGRAVPGTHGKKAQSEAKSTDTQELQDVAEKVAQDINALRSDVEQGLTFVYGEVQKTNKLVQQLRQDMRRKDPNASTTRLNQQMRDARGRYASNKQAGIPAGTSVTDFLKANPKNPENDDSGLGISDVLKALAAGAGGAATAGIARQVLTKLAYTVGRGAGSLVRTLGPLAAVAGATYSVRKTQQEKDDFYNQLVQKQGKVKADQWKHVANRGIGSFLNNRLDDVYQWMTSKKKDEGNDATQKAPDQPAADGDKNIAAQRDLKITSLQDIFIEAKNELTLKGRVITIDAERIKFKGKVEGLQGIAGGQEEPKSKQQATQPSPSFGQTRQQAYSPGNGLTKFANPGNTSYLGGVPRQAGGGSSAGRVTQSSGGGGDLTGGGGPESSNAWDKMTRNTPLQGKWDLVEATAKANGVPPSVMGGVILHETGMGRNTRNNNVAGLMDPKTNSSTKLKFDSVEEGIAAAGKTIGRHYAQSGGDLGKMGKSYAPPGAANDPGNLNSGWAGGVKTFAGKLGGVTTSSASFGGAMKVLKQNGKSADQEHIQSLNPELKNRLVALGIHHSENNNGEQLPVNSANRTLKEQTDLWNNRRNNPNPVARPGHSKHENGRAFDMPAELAAQYEKDGTFDKLGLYRPYSNDPVHVELRPNAPPLPKETMAKIDALSQEQTASVTPKDGVKAKSTQPGGDQKDRPYYFGGQGTMEGYKGSFHFGTGGHNRGSIPYGDYPVTPDTIGPWGKEHGAIGLNNNEIPDPKFPGKPRTGIEIHSWDPDQLNRLYSDGCIAVDSKDWPAFKAHLMNEIKTKGPMYLHIGQDGSASLTHNNGDQVAGTEGVIQSPKGGGAKAATEQKTTPVVPAKPASVSVDPNSQIGGYVSGGKLSQFATYMGRNKIIAGLGKLYNKLPQDVQDHLRSAGQIDFNKLAPYAHLLPEGIRKEFEKNGVKFTDAVPQSGGEPIQSVSTPNASAGTARQAAQQEFQSDASKVPQAQQPGLVPTPDTTVQSGENVTRDVMKTGMSKVLGPDQLDKKSNDEKIKDLQSYASNMDAKPDSMDLGAGDLDKQIKQGDASLVDKIPTPDTTVPSGDDVTADVKNDDDTKAKRADNKIADSGGVKSSGTSSSKGSLRAPVNNPESEAPSPGSDGYGDQTCNPDGGGLCAI